MDAEVKVGAEVGADSAFVHHAEGWSELLANVIYKSCYLVDSVCIFLLLYTFGIVLCM